MAVPAPRIVPWRQARCPAGANLPPDIRVDEPQPPGHDTGSFLTTALGTIIGRRTRLGAGERLEHTHPRLARTNYFFLLTWFLTTKG